MPTSTRSPEAVLAKLTEYAQRFPALARLQELGTTHEGRPILCLCIGRDVQASDPRPSMFLNGAHHGGELASIDVVMDAIETLLGQTDDPRISRFLDELCIFCVPQVNPDGVYSVLHDLARGDRKNARDNNDNHRVDEQDGVDLNRNYPFRWGSLGESGSSKDPKSVYYRGPAAASEPETQAMMRLAEREHPTASISYHTGTVAILAPYTIPGAQSPEPNEAWEVAAALAAAMPPHPQGRNFAVQKNLYPVDGTDQDWLRHGFGTLALIVECARSTPKSADERAALIRTVRDSWMLLFERFLDGPSVSGTVRNEHGQPVRAEITIAEQTLHEGECWTTRPRDGRFDRFLPAAGRYTLRARVEGLAAVEQAFEIERGWQQIDLTLHGAPGADSSG